MTRNIGKPPKWTPIPEPRQLKFDDGEYFRDPNSANFPEHPIEPAVIAALTMDPELARKANVVACGSTLGNLLRFICGEDKQFRMLVELVGETVFFVRRENTPHELIPDIKGYGHTFPETYTTWDPVVRGSSSHQRVLTYRFGGLDFLVRFEGDGYIVDGDEEDNNGYEAPSTPAKHGNDETFDELSAALADNRVTRNAPGNGDLDLKVLHAGSLVQQGCVFELKTRSVKRKEGEAFEDTFGDQLHRLWVAQIPKFILAYHNRGTFEEITVRDVQNEVRGWERDHVDVLSRLAALIHHIIGLTRARPDNKLELRHDAVGILEVREQLEDAGDALSAAVARLWAGGEAASHEASSDSEEYHSVSQDSSDAGYSDVGWEDGFEPDYTACSAEDCGYCGRCLY